MKHNTKSYQTQIYRHSVDSSFAQSFPLFQYSLYGQKSNLCLTSLKISSRRLTNFHRMLVFLMREKEPQLQEISLLFQGRSKILENTKLRKRIHCDDSFQNHDFLDFFSFLFLSVETLLRSGMINSYNLMNALIKQISHLTQIKKGTEILKYQLMSYSLKLVFYFKTVIVKKLIKLIMKINKSKLQILNMTASSQSVIQQFRTVVAGYRFHGQLFKNSSSQTIFTLNILSSANQQESYQIIFDRLFLAKCNLIDLFPSPKELYEHLSKMTKMKVKFNPEAKILSILHEKQKIVKQFPINLLETQNDVGELSQKQMQTCFSDQKEQNFVQIVPVNSNEQIQQKESEQKKCLDLTNVNKNEIEQIQEEAPSGNNKVLESTQLTNVPDKMEQLRKLFERMQAKNQVVTESREAKPINYTFLKQQKQPLTLYEFALENKLESLTDMIQSQELEKNPQIILKKNRLNVVPPFNQISLNLLIHLSLEQNKIETIQYLQRMPNLQKLNLDGNCISRIENLPNLQNLTTLKLGNNNISRIEGLEKLIKLEILWLDFNSIQKIEGLENLQKLKSLNLSFNMIKKIENLSSLTNLEELLLNENQLEQIQNLQNLAKLTRLSLSMNQVKKIKGIKKLLLLEVLHLTNNQIELFDKNAFDQLNWLKMLKQLKINQNLIQWNSESTNFVQRLRNYGVKVTL